MRGDGYWRVWQRSLPTVLIVLGFVTASCGEEQIRRGTIDGKGPSSPSSGYRCLETGDMMDCSDEELNDLLDKQYEEEIGDKWEEWLNDENTVLNPNTHVFADETIDGAIRVEDDEVVLPRAGNAELEAKIEPFWFIVSTHPEHSFLRQVLELELSDAEIVMKTQNASLEQIVISVE